MIPKFEVYFEVDEDGGPESPSGGPIPEPEAEYLENVCRRQDPVTGEWRDITYEEYCEYEGDPERHVTLVCVVVKQCPCCKGQQVASSLHGIDMMDDDPGVQAINIDEHMTPKQAMALPGYLGEVAREQLNEAGWKEVKTKREPRGNVDPLGAGGYGYPGDGGILLSVKRRG